MSDRQTQYKGKRTGRRTILPPEGEEYVYQHYVLADLTGPEVQKLVKKLYKVDLDLSTISRIAKKIGERMAEKARLEAMDTETPDMFESSPAA